MPYRIGVTSTRGVGPERGGRIHNEDNYLICHGSEVRFRKGEGEHVDHAEGSGSLLAVCDGMGGHDDGARAATLAVQELSKLYRPGLPRYPAPALLRFVMNAHKRLYWKLREDGPVTMGTTLTALWLLPHEAAWVQVGDSRLYLFREGALTKITPEHTHNEFARRDGLPPPETGNKLAQSFIFGSRGMGDETALRLEHELDAGTFSVEKGDVLVLCTDGVCGILEDAAIAEVLGVHSHDPDGAAVALMDRAVVRGSTDNITVMVIRIDDPAGSAEKGTWEDDEESTVWF